MTVGDNLFRFSIEPGKERHEGLVVLAKEHGQRVRDRGRRGHRTHLDSHGPIQPRIIQSRVNLRRSRGGSTFQLIALTE